MAKLFDEKGAEVEAFTAEELKVKQDEAIAEHLKNNPDKSAEITKLQSDLKEAQDKLVDAGNMPEGQKQRLKDAKDAAELAVKEVTDRLTKEMSDMKETFTGGIKNKVISALSKNDPDMKAKIELKYNTLMKSGEYKNDEAGITQALTEAATIVTGNKPAPGFLDNLSGAGDRGAAQANKGTEPESENSKAMRGALGITDANASKYTPK